MKSLKEYLTESKKTYTFRVKVAGDVTTEDETKLRGLLDRFSITEFKKTAQTPVQSFPLDFPKIRNRNVNVWEVTLDYPTTSNELTEYLSSNLGRTNEELVVRSPYEPTEEYQQPLGEFRDTALLNDPDYKESPNANWDDHWGVKHNENLIKSLSADSKKRRAELGEQIPNAVSDEVYKNPGVTSNNNTSYNTKANLIQAPDPRRK
jgi:hypothetical protein